MGSSAFVSTNNGECALSGRMRMTGLSISRFAITIRKEAAMARDPIHPGRFLADELDALGMSVPQVAEVLHVPANRIYQLLKGQRALTADTALRLSQWLGTSAEMWLNLQKLYELRLAEQKTGKKIKSTIVRREAAQAA
jgi:addiction module HigA family antidote